MPGYLITFKPCGHVQHWPSAPQPGLWLTHFGVGENPCQSPRAVASVRRCPGCPECREQPVLVQMEAA